MSLRSKRTVVAVLALTAATVGVWAAAFPLSFYADFPLPGRGWVSGLGPYNEHLVRDVGGLYLALVVLSAWTWRRPSPPALRVTGGAWLVFNAEHLLWHALHLDGFPVADRVGIMVSLGGLLVLSVLLLLPDRPAPAVDGPALIAAPSSADTTSAAGRTG
jgi:hypothetical protein